MNSILRTEKLKQFSNNLKPEMKNALLRSAYEYYEIGQSGNSQRIRKAYCSFLYYVNYCERETNIYILESSDDSYICALNALAGHIYRQLKKPKKMEFQSVEETNTWLRGQKNIHVTGFQLEVEDKYGMLANHALASKITIQYTIDFSSVQYQYGMMEEENVNLFKHKDSDDYVQLWEAKNPGFECVLEKEHSNIRSDSDFLSVKYKRGSNYAENVKHFVIYRRKAKMDNDGGENFDKFKEPVRAQKKHILPNMIVAFKIIFFVIFFILMLLIALSQLVENDKTIRSAETDKCDLTPKAVEILQTESVRETADTVLNYDIQIV